MEHRLAQSLAASGYSAPGFADRYDRARPRPPGALGELIPPLLKPGPLRVVVDLGSGTGLSTRFWAPTAFEVIGIEPNTAMREFARQITAEPNVRYVEGSGERTGLGVGAADLVTAAQSFHWMDPEPTLREISRILRPGGILCVYQYASLITPAWDAGAAWGRLRAAVARFRDERGLNEALPRRPVSQATFEASGTFRHVAETAVHSIEHGDGRRLLDFAMSEGSLQTLLDTGVTEEEIGLDELRRATSSVTSPVPWWIGYRVWIGLRD